MTEELPESVVDEAERLTRLAREAIGPEERAACERERDRLLAEHGFEARVREDGEDRPPGAARESGATLVLRPAKWVEDGTVVRGRIEDLERAVERSLSGPGDPDEWAAVAEHNRELARSVRAAHGDVHGDNADALAAFMHNHYAKRVEAATGAELREFIEEYFPRNAWPGDEQRRVVERSVELVFEAADRPVPSFEE